MGGVLFVGALYVGSRWLGSRSGWGSRSAPSAVLAASDVPREVMNLQDSFANVAATVKPAVVNLSVASVQKVGAPPMQFFFGDPFEDFFGEFFGQRPGRRRGPVPEHRPFRHRTEGTGSGVIIDADGYVLTNEHVIRGATDIKVRRIDERGKEHTYSGQVIGKDERTDLAVVRIKTSDTLSAASLGDSDKIRVGDWVIAIGSPFGLEQTVTAGIISAKRQSLPIEGRTYRDLIQTDASINRGNSGGPLLNLRGEVIGINTAIFAPTGVFNGIGFAIPVNRAKEILDDLIHKGKVVRGWLGIEIKKVDEAIAKQFGLPDASGVLVNQVMKDGPAEKGGLKRGDVIRTINGVKVSSPEALQAEVSKAQPKSRALLTVIRARQTQTIALVLGEMPQNLEEARAGGGV